MVRLDFGDCRTWKGREADARFVQVDRTQKKMPKASGKKPKASTVDSSDEDDATAAAATGTGAAAARAAVRKKPPFDKKKVLLAVLGRDAPGAQGTNDEKSTGCAQRLPSFFTGDVVQAWVDWADRTPSTLADVPEEHRLRHCAMPKKCLPPGASVVEVARVQRELITYSNSDGRSVGKQAISRDADAHKPLYEHDVKVGSTVALKRAAIDVTKELDPGGYNTPFYIGDVRSVSLAASSSSSAMVACASEGAGSSSSHAAAGPRLIESVVIHYRMPLERNHFVDDVKKPWALACHGLHVWTHACSRAACKRAAIQAGSNSTAMLYTVDPKSLMEVDLTLKAGLQLDKKSRERLAEHGPADSRVAWRNALGLTTSAEAETKKSKRIRR